jgi:hypothetical protein
MGVRWSRRRSRGGTSRYSGEDRVFNFVFSDGGTPVTYRTPVKHRLLNAWVGKDVGAGKHAAPRKFFRPYGGHLIVDLTAGSAVGDGTNDWWYGSSPAIFSRIAAENKLIRVHLYDKDKAAFQALISNLGQMLPAGGFNILSETSWYHSVTDSTVQAFFGDARELEQFELRDHECLFVNDDPNNMHGLVLDLVRLQEVIKRPRNGFVTFMTTMGCNVGGLKRLEHDERLSWFRHIEQAINIMQETSRLDLLLFEIMRDDAQWAYLLLVPEVWSRDMQPSYVKEFTKQGLRAQSYSWRHHRQQFIEAINRLFHTQKERGDGRFWQI